MHAFTNRRGWTQGNLETHTLIGVTNFHINDKNTKHTHTHTHTHTQMIHTECGECYSRRFTLRMSALLSLCFSTTSGKNIYQSTEEPPGGERTGLTEIMAPRIPPLLPQPVLLPSTCQKNNDISTPDKYNTECCKCNAFFSCFTAEFLWMFCPWRCDCLRGCQRLRTSWVLWFFRYKTRHKGVHNEKAHDGREKNSPLPTKKVLHIVCFQVHELWVNGTMMGEKFNLQQEKQKWKKWAEGGGYVVCICDVLRGGSSKRCTRLGAVCWWQCWQCELYWKTRLQWSEAVWHHLFGLAVILRGENWMNHTQICKPIRGGGKDLTACGRNPLQDAECMYGYDSVYYPVSWKERRRAKTTKHSSWLRVD